MRKTHSAIAPLREYFASGATLYPDARRHALSALERLIADNEPELCRALEADLGKTAEETWLTEIQMVRSEVTWLRRHLSSLMHERRVWPSLASLPGRGSVRPDPYGVVLIAAPWNYPLQLLLSPLAGALAAGNCALLKPSPQAPATATLIAELVSRYFEPGLVSVVLGDGEAMERLLDEPFDFIFFTGSPGYGRHVAMRAAERLIPVALELGGKCPVIVADGADLGVAARRIVWGKLLNAGQTCVAPDYVLVCHHLKNALIEQLRCEIIAQAGADPRQNPAYPHIVSEAAVERLAELTSSSGRVVWGGDFDLARRFFAPTLVADPTPASPLMQEEIFGPILPIVSVADIDEAITFVNTRPHPLALYFFGRRCDARRVGRQTASGALGINDVVMHMANPRLPFGGVGQSGIGRYHGADSFATFSYRRAIYDAPRSFDLPLRYMPYTIKSWLKRWL